LIFSFLQTHLYRTPTQISFTYRCIDQLQNKTMSSCASATPTCMCSQGTQQYIITNKQLHIVNISNSKLINSNHCNLWTVTKIITNSPRHEQSLSLELAKKIISLKYKGELISYYLICQKHATTGPYKLIINLWW
jgi:hypothetical protein